MKGEALLMFEKYEASIKLCEQTIDLARKNSPPVDANRYPDSHDTPKDINYSIWRCRLMLKSYFHMGKLEEAINYRDKQELLLSATKRDGNTSLESFIPLAATMRDLLRLKSAGNEAFQSGRHTEAVLLQLRVSVIGLRHIRLLVNFLTLLQTAVFPLLLTKITQRFLPWQISLFGLYLFCFCFPQHDGRSELLSRTVGLNVD